MIKKFNRNKKEKIKFLEIKNVISEMEIILMGLMTEEKMSEI